MEDRFQDKRHIRWAKDVKARDNYECQICRATNVYLHSHHLNSYDVFVNQRYDINNGITLCFRCHTEFHLIFSKGRNTKFQFEQYKKSIEIFKKVLLKKYCKG